MAGGMILSVSNTSHYAENDFFKYADVKQIYLATMNAQTKWTGTIFAWSAIRRDLTDYFKTRFNNTDTIN